SAEARVLEGVSGTVFEGVDGTALEGVDGAGIVVDGLKCLRRGVESESGVGDDIRRFLEGVFVCVLGTAASFAGVDFVDATFPGILPSTLVVSFNGVFSVVGTGFAAA